MSKEFQIAPCFFCGSFKPKVYAEGNAKKIFNEDGSEDFFFTDVFGYCCECTECGVMTSQHSILADAIGEWNFMYKNNKLRGKNDLQRV